MRCRLRAAKCRHFKTNLEMGQIGPVSPNRTDPVRPSQPGRLRGAAQPLSSPWRVKGRRASGSVVYISQDHNDAQATAARARCYLRRPASAVRVLGSFGFGIRPCQWPSTSTYDHLRRRSHPGDGCDVGLPPRHSPRQGHSPQSRREGPGWHRVGAASRGEGRTGSVPDPAQRRGEQENVHVSLGDPGDSRPHLTMTHERLPATHATHHPPSITHRLPAAFAAHPYLTTTAHNVQSTLLAPRSTLGSVLAAVRWKRAWRRHSPSHASDEGHHEHRHQPQQEAPAPPAPPPSTLPSKTPQEVADQLALLRNKGESGLE